ncbi:MAG TPA: zinc-binding dehydrogenase [Chloroflexota bacterium]|nr:zinc-binding dehydrogenase [Chloroflexota bacterium]
MRAVVLEAPCRLVVRDVREPRLGRDEMLIRVELASLCGACAVCAYGKGSVCHEKRSLGVSMPGAFADLVAIPAGFAHPLPDEIALRDAVLIEPLAVALHAWRLSEAQADDAVAVIGCGSEGLLLIRFALSRGARVLAADVDRERLALAHQLGAARLVQIDADRPSVRLAAQIEADWSPTVIFEAAGAAAAVELALSAVARGGRVVLVGRGAQSVPLIPRHFVRRALTLIGSLIYDHPADFVTAIELVRTGEFTPGTLVSRIAPLTAVADLLDAASRQPGKVVLDVCAAR